MENFSEFDNLTTTPQRDSSSIIAHAFNKYKKVMWYGVLMLVGATIVSSILSSLVGHLVGYDQTATQEIVREAIRTKNFDLLKDIQGLKSNSTFSFLISLFFVPLYAGFMYLMNKVNFQEEITFSDLFIGYTQNTLQLVLYYVISTIVVAISFSLCFFPGLFIAPLFFLGLPIVFFENATAMDALKKSFETVKNNYWPFLGLAILTFLIVLSGLLLCCIGILLTAMFVFAVKYSAYCAYFGAPKAIVTK